MRRRLFIDLDGVLADFDAHYDALFGARLQRGTDPPGFWDNIRGHGSFFADLPLMPDARALWEGLADLGPVVLTGCPPEVPDAALQKRAWCRRHLGPGVVAVTCRSEEKRLHGRPGDVLVDDWVKYRHLWEGMGGVFVLHTSAAASVAEVRRVWR